ncbi:hypothetical protein QNH20_11905 [Neobacillus sp. WH10]|uniref:hypothetical protein n=1 Tax=Neobacillus sp. WH10 TaxID=3047873 RepID=UPI0024C0F6E9|nr:hypothetical protein [Neobacillus sp. WH10]WHY79802.1 hypothetical protein QNH20_11905 [Neobacillus sp. WH10]
MVIPRAQIDKTDLTQYIPPKGDFEVFRDDDHYKEKLKEWGLSSAKEAKREFWYKDRSNHRLVTIKGYEVYGGGVEYNTIVIEFQDGNLSCIHPAYIKEMQQSSFGKESLLALEDLDSTSGTVQVSVKEIVPSETETVNTKESPKKEKAAKSAKEAKPKKEKAPKLELPAEKVHFTAKVKQFSLVYNPFNEENDEVVVLENVQIVQDNPLDLGLAWCSHSKTLKKFELVAGDLLEFDGKVAAKKMGKGKDAPEEFVVDTAVLYKVNNPSKIIKK